jgi:hypothetical protein
LTQIQIDTLLSVGTPIATIMAVWWSYIRNKTNRDIEYGRLMDKVCDLSNNLEVVRKSTQEQASIVRDMDQAFWRDRWPQVVGVVTKVEHLTTRIEDIAARLEAHDSRLVELERSNRRTPRK